MVDEGHDLVIRGATVVLPHGRPRPATVAIRGDRIHLVEDSDVTISATTVIDASGQYLLPGIVDAHVHYRYGYGYKESSSEYESETSSSLLGGVTTVLRMHRDLQPLARTVPSEIESIGRDARVDVALHAAIMTDQQMAEIPAIASLYGITSFKLFMAYRGRAGSLQSILGLGDGALFACLRAIAGVPGGIACVHAETSEVTLRLSDEARAAGEDGLSAWEAVKPAWTEAEGISRAAYMAQAAGCPLYIVHISSVAGVRAVEEARARGAEIYAETCGHYLTHTADSELGGLAKVDPPLRRQRDIDALWDAIAGGVIDTIATDHVAHSRAKVRDTIWDTMPGFAGTATLVPAVWTYGVAAGRITPERFVQVMSSNPAAVFGLTDRGTIAPGMRADLTILDPADERPADAIQLGSASDYSIYEGVPLRGWPTTVVRRGAVAMMNGQVLTEPGSGGYVHRQLVESSRAGIRGGGRA